MKSGSTLKKNDGRFKKGHASWSKGRKFSDKHRKNLSIAHIGKKIPPEVIEKRSAKIRGNKHFLWKGDAVGYYALHIWVIRNWGPATKCEFECVYPRKNAHGVLMLLPKRYEWANINGHYDRKRSSWKMLCPSCHRKYDREFNIRKKK